MRGSSLSVLAVVVLFGAVGFSLVSRAQDSDAAEKKAKKPAPVSVVESVPVEVTATAAPLPVTVSAFPFSTHIGQRVDDFVVLSLVNPLTTPIFVRNHDDGTQDTAEFVVPTGSHLVVTDVDWVVSDNNLNYFDATLRLFVEKGSSRCPVALLTNGTSNIPAGTTGGSSGRTWGSTGIVAGFVVGAGARVVADVRDVRSSVSVGSSLAAFNDPNVTVILRGYLAK